MCSLTIVREHILRRHVASRDASGGLGLELLFVALAVLARAPLSAVGADAGAPHLLLAVMLADTGAPQSLHLLLRPPGPK